MSQSEKLDLILREVSTIKADMRSLKEDMAQLDKHVFRGNGTPSLMTRVSVVEVKQKDLVWYKRLIVGAAITGLSGLVFSIIKATG